MGEPEGKRLLGGPRRRWEGPIKLNLNEIERRAWVGFVFLRIRTSGGLRIS
jgi:hypothetical protein